MRSARSNPLHPAILIILFVLIAAFPAHTIAEGRAADIVEQTGISRGVCAVIGTDDMDTALNIIRDYDFFVHIQDSGAGAVENAKKLLDDAGLYGKRAVVELGTADAMMFADNTVDLAIVLSEKGKSSTSDIMRVLRPGGVVVVVTEKGTLLSSKKEQPDGMDDWTHWEHGPDNNPVSTDSVIKAPYMTQWFGEPYYSAMPAITTIAGGRNFLAMGHIAHHEREEKWLNTIYARNGYNGTKLWTRKLPDGYLVHRSAFVATDETFYMIDPSGSGCLMLDPETGVEKGQILIPEVSGEWKWMAIKNGIMYVLAGKIRDPKETTIVRSPHAGWSWIELSKGYYEKEIPWGFGGTIIAYDIGNKKLLWTHTEEKDVDSRAMVMGGGKVFFYGPESHIGCLDETSGTLLWTNGDSEIRGLIEEIGDGFQGTVGFRTTCINLYTPEGLFFEADARKNLVAVSVDDGSMMWTKPKNTNDPNMLYVDDHLFAGMGERGSILKIEPASGKQVEDLGFRKLNCARFTANPEAFFCRSTVGGFTRVDRASGKINFNRAIRPACNDGVISANGMIYLGPWLCDCNLTLIGAVGMSSANGFDFKNNVRERGRLTVGEGGTDPSFSGDVSGMDWPTYRANNSRSAASSAVVPIDSLNTGKIWEFKAAKAYQPTTPTAAYGLIYIGGDDCKVRAVDAATGELRWSYLTAGPIKQPPTIWNGRTFAGSGDGYIYSLDAMTGRLLWKFRAAPEERRIMMYGALCSLWPVNSGILVEDGIAYAAAGIIDYDGTYVYALDAATGKVKWHNDTSGHLDKDLRKGVSAQGMLTISDGCLYLAGGNVVSPASYDLKNGKCLNKLEGTGWGNRGEEIGVFGGGVDRNGKMAGDDKYVLFGGRLQFSATQNVVNPGKFETIGLKKGKRTGVHKTLNKGKIPPSWDDKSMVFVDGRNASLSCYAAGDIVRYLNNDRNNANLPETAWTANIVKNPDERNFRTTHTWGPYTYNIDTVSISLARNAVVTVRETVRHGTLQSVWEVCAVDSETGAELWKHTLSEWGMLGGKDNVFDIPALPGSLIIDRDGQVVVVLQNGSILCFGEKR
jgi:outer membrane protein assembly factor BamB